mgnify:CR=1 FL=1
MRKKYGVFRRDGKNYAREIADGEIFDYQLDGTLIASGVLEGTRPSPPAVEVNGTVMWSGYDGRIVVVADQVTAEVAAKAFRNDFTVEGLRMLLKQETEEKVRRGLALADKDDEIARLTDEVASLKQHNATTMLEALEKRAECRDKNERLMLEVTRLRGALEEILIVAARGGMSLYATPEYNEIAVKCSVALRGGK